MKPLLITVSASDATLPPGKGALSRPLAASWAMPQRAFYSSDGKEWHATANGENRGGEMHYVVPGDKTTVLVAWGPPYSPSYAGEVIASMAQEYRLADELELCKSKEGRSVPMLRVCEGDRVEARRFGVWIQARQHAWETGSSWVCHGFMEWLKASSDEATWLRQHAEIFIVPVMDVDNAATGNGGKDALPQDHNRDWGETPHWNEVAAAQRIIQRLVSEDRMDVFVDLHNPAPGDHEAFFFASPEGMLSREALKGRSRLMALALAGIAEVMPVKTDARIAGAGYHPLWRQISGNWVTENGNSQTVALCLETPWNTEFSTVEGYKRVGRALAQAVQSYLREQPRRS